MGWVRGWVECVGAAGTPTLHTHQFQAEPCRGSRRVASSIERIDLGCARNPMLVLIGLTAPSLGWQVDIMRCTQLCVERRIKTRIRSFAQDCLFALCCLDQQIWLVQFGPFLW